MEADNTLTASETSARQARIRLSPATRRALWRLMPLLLLFYIVNYLDRVNIGFAASTMNVDLGMSTTAYGLGAGLFFISYFLLEVPSNWIMQRVGAKPWLIRILLTWGVLSTLMCVVNNVATFYILRILIGAAEAGFIPAIHYLLSNWFPVRIRGRVNSLFYIAMPVATIIGAPLSTLLIEYSESWFHVAGWRVMFALEGLPSIALGVIAIWGLAEKPATAKWLAPAERDELTEAVAHDQAVVRAGGREISFLRSLIDTRVLVLGFALASYIFAMYALSFFLPLVISSFNSRFGHPISETLVGVLTVIPYAFATVAMLLWGHHSDKTGERAWHVGISGLVGAAGILLAAFFLHSPVIVLIGVTICAVGLYAALPAFWSMPSSFLTGAAYAGGIAMINSLVNVGSFATSYVTGWLNDLTGSYTVPFIVVATLFAAGAVVVLTYGKKVMAASAPAVD